MWPQATWEEPSGSPNLACRAAGGEGAGRFRRDLRRVGSEPPCDRSVSTHVHTQPCPRPTGERTPSVRGPRSGRPWYGMSPLQDRGRTASNTRRGARRPLKVTVQGPLEGNAQNREAHRRAGAVRRGHGGASAGGGGASGEVTRTFWTRQRRQEAAQNRARGLSGADLHFKRQISRNTN